MLDKHMSWIDHVRTVENKIAKNISSLYCVNQFLNEVSLFLVYSFLFELCKYCMGEYVCNEIKKSFFCNKNMQ